MLKLKVNVCQDFITFYKQMQMAGNSYAVHHTHYIDIWNFTDKWQQ